MPRSPRRLTSEEQLYAAALRALMRRAHSIHDMRVYLERRAEPPALVQRVLQRLKNEGLLDDARYARQFARYHAEARHQGRYRIARELRARGVPDRHIAAALEEALSAVDEAGQVKRLIERRLRHLRGALDDRRMASLYRTLLRAGFSSEVIRQELRNLTRLSMEQLPETASEE